MCALAGINAISAQLFLWVEGHQIADFYFVSGWLFGDGGAQGYLQGYLIGLIELDQTNNIVDRLA